MKLNEQFERFLAGLGVEMEQPQEKRYEVSDALPEVSIFQASRDHYGVFYRLDLIDNTPELRIMLPSDRGATRTDIYLVRPASHMPVLSFFQNMGNYQGSNTYEDGRDAALQHLLYATAEMLKQLFWSGDLENMHFCDEIEVFALHVSQEESLRKAR
jgi:hypothetical protein